MKETLEKIISWKIRALVFLLPLFFLPITIEFYVFNKQTLLLFATGGLLVLWALKMLLEKSLKFKKTPLDLPVLLLALAYVTATILASPNKVEALMNSTSVGTVLILTILYFVITNNLSISSFSSIISSSIASASILGLIAIYQFIGLGEAYAPVDWMKFKFWTPAGGPLILLTFLGVNLVLAITLFLRKLNQKGWLGAIWSFAANLLIALGLILTISLILPGKEASLFILPYQESWSIAVEAFKQNPLVGVGPGNYLTAFNRFRTIAFNAYEFWNARFTNASSFPLEILTVSGLLGFATYLVLVRQAFSLGKKAKMTELKLGLLALLAVQIFLPINFLILTMTFLFLAFISLQESKEVSLPSPELLVRGVFGLVCLLVIVGFYFWGRAYAADLSFRQSLTALMENRGTDTYNLQVKAISLNPRQESFRVSYSQTNFALANALASQENLSDQDRANISQLIQQAIREAKVATVLNPNNAAYWENLAQLYRNLINFAEGADQWAIAAYQQAITNDPVNPRLRVNLGGLFYALGNYEAAVRRFENAVNLKPDYANGYYNLAATYREQGKYTEAFNAMQTVVNLLPVDSPDYQQVVDELEDIRTKLPTPGETETPVETGELAPPQPLPSPVIQPPIKLPEEAGLEVIPTPETTPALIP